MMVHAERSSAKPNLILDKNVFSVIQDIKIYLCQILWDLFADLITVRKSLMMVRHVSNVFKDLN